MTTKQPQRVTHAGDISQTLNEAEGGSGGFELLTQERSRHLAPTLCAVVRSTTSRRVYLLEHRNEPADAFWQNRCEIIGFDGLRRLRKRRRRLRRNLAG
jgi:hypothetical protein